VDPTNQGLLWVLWSKGLTPTSYTLYVWLAVLYVHCSVPPCELVVNQARLL
jgi:hypothetical protein